MKILPHRADSLINIVAILSYCQNFQEKCQDLAQNEDAFDSLGYDVRRVSEKERNDRYSSNEIRKTQNEELNIVCQNLNHL